MPHHAAISSPLPLKILTCQVISLARAHNTDFKFFRDVAENPNTPEFGGYNTNIARNEGYSPKRKTKAVYLPLFDMPPAEPTTILTAMIEAQKLMQLVSIILFLQSLQFYRVAVNITWVYNDHFVTLIPRIGRMHTLMNFIGAIGTLMIETGLQGI